MLEACRASLSMTMVLSIMPKIPEILVKKKMEHFSPGGDFPVKWSNFKRWSSLTSQSYRPKIVVPFSEFLVSSPAPRHHTIAGFHCHAIKIKIENHSMNEVKKFTRYRRYINKYSVQASGLCGIPYSSYLI